MNEEALSRPLPVLCQGVERNVSDMLFSYRRIQIARRGAISN